MDEHRDSLFRRGDPSRKPLMEQVLFPRSKLGAAPLSDHRDPIESKPLGGGGSHRSPGPADKPTHLLFPPPLSLPPTIPPKSWRIVKTTLQPTRTREGEAEFNRYHEFSLVSRTTWNIGWLGVIRENNCINKGG